MAFRRALGRKDSHHGTLKTSLILKFNISAHCTQICYVHEVDRTPSTQGTQNQPRSSNAHNAQVIFPSDWTSPSGASKFAEQQFQVQRSDSPAFSSPTTVPGPFLSSGATWVALDGVSNGTAMPYYRVQLTDTQGGVIATSPVAQPFEQAGMLGQRPGRKHESIHQIT